MLWPSPRLIWPAEHARSGDAPEVGLEQRARKVAAGEVLHHQRERMQQALELDDVVVGEAARAARRQAHRVAHAFAEHDLGDDVVGEAQVAQFAQHGVVELVAAQLEAAADGTLARGDARRGAVAVLLGMHEIVIARPDQDLLAVPVQGHAEILRMQGGKKERHALDRHAGGAHAFAQFPHHRFARGKAPPLVQQPVDHGRHRPPGHGAGASGGRAAPRA